MTTSVITTDTESFDGVVSLFSSAGFGDFGICKGNNIPLICASELLPERCDQLRLNFPEAKVFQGDISLQKKYIVQYVHETLNGKRPKYMIMSPPCQGMSSNGVGRIHSAMKEGTRSDRDERNELIVQSIDIAKQLKPDWVIVENVSNMAHTKIPIQGQMCKILDYIHKELEEYTIFSEVVDFADYGVPQHRTRLITIACRIPAVCQMIPRKNDLQVTISESPFHPSKEHLHTTMRQAIGHLPELDALHHLEDVNDSFHVVPKWNHVQYKCMKYTPEGKTAFENSCMNCNAQNPLRTLYCENCNSELPRPNCTFIGWKCKICRFENRKSQKKCKCGNDMPDDTEFVSLKRVCSGFKTSYRRQFYDRPSNTLTQNSGVISSDCKGHPTQNRVLSLREILILSSMDPNPVCSYDWQGKYMWCEHLLNAKFVRQSVGESIPPLASFKIVQQLKKIEEKL